MGWSLDGQSLCVKCNSFYLFNWKLPGECFFSQKTGKKNEKSVLSSEFYSKKCIEATPNMWKCIKNRIPREYWQKNHPNFDFKTRKKSLLVSVKKKWLQIIEPIEFHSKNKSQFHRTLRAIGTITLFFSFLFIKHKVELCHLHDDHSDQTFGMLIPSRWKYWMNHRIS